MLIKKNYYVYITTNFSKTVLYTGITNSLYRRMREHYANKGTNNSFTGKFYAYNLLYVEQYRYPTTAIAREKAIKRLTRARKEELINDFNPEWKLLNNDILGNDWFKGVVKR